MLPSIFVQVRGSAWHDLGRIYSEVHSGRSKFGFGLSRLLPSSLTQQKASTFDGSMPHSLQSLHLGNASVKEEQEVAHYYSEHFCCNAVTDMEVMFRESSSFNQEDLSSWDTSAVTTMYGMFNRASAFDGSIYLALYTCSM